MPVATAMADPPLDPPGMRVGVVGVAALRAGDAERELVGGRLGRSRSRRRRAAGRPPPASRVGDVEVGVGAGTGWAARPTSMTSFTVIGMPCSGPQRSAGGELGVEPPRPARGPRRPAARPRRRARRRGSSTAASAVLDELGAGGRRAPSSASAAPIGQRTDAGLGAAAAARRRRSATRSRAGRPAGRLERGAAGGGRRGADAARAACGRRRSSARGDRSSASRALGAAAHRAASAASSALDGATAPNTPPCIVTIFSAAW